MRICWSARDVSLIIEDFERPATDVIAPSEVSKPKTIYVWFNAKLSVYICTLEFSRIAHVYPDKTPMCIRLIRIRDQSISIYTCKCAVNFNVS